MWLARPPNRVPTAEWVSNAGRGNWRRFAKARGMNAVPPFEVLLRQEHHGSFRGGRCALRSFFTDVGLSL